MQIRSKNALKYPSIPLKTPQKIKIWRPPPHPLSTDVNSFTLWWDDDGSLKENAYLCGEVLLLRGTEMSRREDADLSIVYVLYQIAGILDVDVRE